MSADDYLRTVARAYIAKHVHGPGSPEALAAWDASVAVWRQVRDGERGKARRGLEGAGYDEAAQLAWARRVLG